MARSWVHELDGRRYRSPSLTPAEALAAPLYFGLLVARVSVAIGAGDVEAMRGLLGLVCKGDLQEMNMMGVDLIAAYSDAAGCHPREALRVCHNF